MELVILKLYTNMKQLFRSSILFLFVLLTINQIKSQNLDTANCNLNVELFSFVEKMPVYPGGQESMNAFIKSNLNYPQIAKENGIEGTVLAQFIIDTNGYLLCPKILRSIGGDCDREVLRILGAFP